MAATIRPEPSPLLARIDDGHQSAKDVCLGLCESGLENPYPRRERLCGPVPADGNAAALTEDDVRFVVVEDVLEVAEALIQRGKEAPHDRVVIHELRPGIGDLAEALLEVGPLRDRECSGSHRTRFSHAVR